MGARRRKLIRERLAEADLASQAAYLSERSSPGTALRFLDAVEVAFERIAEMPESGSLWDFVDPRLAGTRTRPVPGFRNHLIFYQIAGEEIRILRVPHAARDVGRAFNTGQ